LAKEAVSNQSLSDDAILAVLESCDFNVNNTITALLEGISTYLVIVM